MKELNENAILNKGNKQSAIKFFHGDGIKIIRKGKAGTLTYINDDKYTINDDAYIMQVKPKYQKEISLKYIYYTQFNKIKECVSSDGEGKNGTFNKTLYEESYINIPDLKEQISIVNEYEHYLSIKKVIQNKIEYIENIIKKTPKYKHGDTYTVSQVFDMISEDRKLIEEYIYNHQGKYPVYSAQVDGAYGYIDKYSYDREILFVVQYGSSGKTYLRSGKLNVGRNVCGLIPNKEFEGKINLRFAKYALENVFIEVSKGTDLKSLSQTTINNTKVFIPDYNTQVLLANEYEKLEIIKNKLQSVLSKVNRVLN